MKKSILCVAGILLFTLARAEIVKIAYPTWAEGVALTHLAAVIIEEELGIDVELTKAEPNVIFEAVANGDQDVFLDAWLPFTHAEYWKQYNGRYERLGTVYMKATTGLAVPSYVNIDNVDELNSISNQVGGQIIGISPDAGITLKTDSAIKLYGLNYTQVTSSASQMLAALDEAVANKQPIVVTAWTPHWMFARYDLKMLGDGKRVYQVEGLRKLARLGFSEDMPAVADFLKKFSLSEQQLQSLILAIHESDQSPDLVAADWAKSNPKLVKEWTKRSFFKRMFN